VINYSSSVSADDWYEEVLRESPPKKVYISTPLKPEKFDLDAIQKEILKAGVFAFIPPTEEKNDRKQGAQIDKLQIELCDEMWVFGPIGRDCAWEIGYAQGLGKHVKFFRSPVNEHVVQEDWMIFAAGTEVVE
jgi:nucleoside 2-deoxyribosyltransferase